MFTKTDFEDHIQQALDLVESKSVADLERLATTASGMTLDPKMPEKTDPLYTRSVNAMALNQMLSSEQRYLLVQFALHVWISQERLEWLADESWQNTDLHSKERLPWRNNYPRVQRETDPIVSTIMTTTEFQYLIYRATEDMDRAMGSELVLLADAILARDLLLQESDRPRRIEELLANSLALKQMLTEEQNDLLQNSTCSVWLASEALKQLSLSIRKCSTTGLSAAPICSTGSGNHDKVAG